MPTARSQLSECVEGRRLTFRKEIKGCRLRRNRSLSDFGPSLQAAAFSHGKVAGSGFWCCCIRWSWPGAMDVEIFGGDSDSLYETDTPDLLHHRHSQIRRRHFDRLSKVRAWTQRCFAARRLASVAKFYETWCGAIGFIYAFHSRSPRAWPKRARRQELRHCARMRGPVRDTE